MRWDVGARIRALAVSAIPVRHRGRPMKMMTMQVVTPVRQLLLAEMASAVSLSAIAAGHS